MNDKKQLKAWTGEFGDDYIRRNEFEEWKIPLISDIYQPILEQVEIDSILEIGSNIGINLAAINRIEKGVQGFMR